MKNSFKILVILILASAMIAFTESRVITGKVTDEQGNPIAGVNVAVKGAPTGTITDLTGNYRITVNDEDKILVFSYSGYTAIEQKIGVKTTINVTMSLKIAAFDELVVTGYGLKKDKASMSAPSAAGMAFESRANFQRYNNNFNT
ncbi:MAG: TonB-dependent starch-binding outer membrane protein SusC, partial [Bacteroidota bacterium]|nr:TonB-dependent starch-binding outer membrane protein SusC [Bacteroidota bacterium]